MKSLGEILKWDYSKLEYFAQNKHRTSFIIDPSCSFLSDGIRLQSVSTNCCVVYEIFSFNAEVDSCTIGSLSNDDGHGNENNRFNEQKQSLCTCVLHFGTFLCRPLQNNNEK